MIKGIEECISGWCFRNRYNNQLQKEWKTKVLKLIDEYIDFLETQSSKF